MSLLVNGVEMPKPDLYAHELVANEGGVWLGVNKKGICEQAHTHGETGDEVREYFTADQLQAYGAAVRAQALEDAAVVCEHINDDCTGAPDGPEDIAAAIRALKGTP